MNDLDDRKNRCKILIRYALGQGIASTQKDLGRLMGYSNESSFSQIINGKVDIPKNFIIKLKNLIPEFNEQWLLTGEGEMVVSEAVTEAPSVATPAGISPALLDKALDEIAAQRRIAEKAQEQIDRLLAIIEGMTGAK